MPDKIQITSDGTVSGTKIKYDNKDMTKDHKVLSVYFSAHGGYTYTSEYSGNVYTNPPRVSYDISYMEDGKEKTIASATPSKNTTKGQLGPTQDNKLSYIGITDEKEDKKLKDKMINALEKIRDKTNLPSKYKLEKRTVNSLIDTYLDKVDEIEELAKKEKENKDK